MPRICSLIMVLALALLSGCAQEPPRPVEPLAEVVVGLAGAEQPMNTVDLLAGYLPEPRELASEKAVLAFDTQLVRLTRGQANPARQFVAVPSASRGVVGPRSAGENTALPHWVEVGRKAGVDLLIVPQILSWHEREGSAMGAMSSAEVNVQFYLIDVRQGTLLARSVFNEKQQSLAGDLLHMRTFFKRGGKWLTANELADEGIVKMIKEFGL